MTHEEAFLEDIRENPDDDVPRLVFADWLDEHGDADRAEFIRARVYWARLSDRESPEAAELKQQASGLLAANWQRWTGPLRRAMDHYSPTWPLVGHRQESVRHFPRGFVDSAELSATRFVDVAADLFGNYPIRQLRLHEVADCAAGLAARPELAWVEVLNLADYYRAPLNARGMAELSRSPHLRRLLLLHLYRNHLGDEGAAALATAPWLDRLRVAGLRDNGLSSRGAAALARTARAFRPERLDLGGNAIGDEGVIALAGSPILERVKVLTLENCSVGERGAAALAESPYLREVELVDLSANPLTAQGQAIVRRAPWGERAKS